MDLNPPVNTYRERFPQSAGDILRTMQFKQAQNLLDQANNIEMRGPLSDISTPALLRHKAGVLLGNPEGITTGPKPTKPNLLNLLQQYLRGQ